MLKLTGERVIPELMKPTNGLLLEHLARYYFATPYVEGRVLDLACGVGYGTHMMAKTCKKEAAEIVGVDVDPETIQYANKTYNHPLITYQTADALDPELPQKLGLFDTIVSFETIEHLDDDQRFMASLYEMLRPGGTLVLSSPFGQGRGKPCSEPFHVHQFTEAEFAELFHAFQEVELYYQRGVTIEPPRRDVKYYLGVAVCKK
ncbi:class I SAM-dependent methyltransferase [Brevibacillus humidisoli]|uniref:class I SAM-dependent methyltransferase n=1 Tax=Brevibacillus humidisoli TaxID=2895522 RepID=UPI001E57B870|nr:class I SAM-dependent methyltransferase [Brevibacillus humidisoli]UFJ39472.1 class I SAM-dependent methyltransferase [Brevibacillus humidisoli]